MIWFWFSAISLACVAVSGCAYPNQYRDAPKRNPHAILSSVNTEGYFGGDVSPFRINGQPTSFWRWNDTFRLRPGTNEIVAVYGGNAFTNPPRQYLPLRLNAHAGHTYTLQHTHSPTDSVFITDSALPTRPVVARAAREEDTRDR